MGRPEGILDEQVEDADVAAAAPPQVFVRTFSTPAGLPWEQARAARLDAEHGAPLPLRDLLHRVKRLAPWSPGAVGRYAVFYVRRRDYRGAFETTVDVDGQPVRVAFGGGGRSVRAPDLNRVRDVGLAVLAVAATLGVAGTGVALAWSARVDAEGRLSALEQQVASRMRAAQKLQSERTLSADLAAARDGAALPGDVVRDLAWLTRSRTADARIVAVHWERGLMAVEARGAAPPLESREREIVRSDRPLRPGIWLWGVGPITAATAPVAAELRP